MRLFYCLECKAVTKVEDYEGPRDPQTGEALRQDALLEDYIQRHMHGLTEETHPGAVHYVLDDSQIDPTVAFHQGGTLSEADRESLESKAFDIVRDHLTKQGRHVAEDLRDEVKDDAMKCWERHGRVEYPGKLCPDYRSASKVLGRRNMNKEDRAYLCTFCPYQVGVEVEKRWRAGGYK
jgi:hypothetical protein